MRLCLFCWLICASVTAQPAPDSAANTSARTARLEGQVLSQSGEPLHKATVRLMHYYADPSSNAVSYFDTSDATGKFVFEGVLPGRYTLTAERAGFLMQSYGARTAANSPGSVLTLAAGQIVKDLSLKLAPQGVILGRVTDVDGDPLPGAEVRVLRVFHSRGQRRVEPFGAARTDDQGSFRIASLSPGSYYLAAEDARLRMFGNTEGMLPGRAPSRLTSVLTYYPDAVDAANAIPLEITPGSELREIEIRIRREAVFSIRGTVIDSATGKAAAVQLVDARLKNDPQTGLGAGASPHSDGTFEIRNLLPRVYVVTAGTNTTADARAAREEVSITDSDVAGVKLTLTPGAAMAGTVKLEGDGSPVHPMIVLNGVLGTENASHTQTKDDGTFEFHGIAPGKYALALDDLPDGVYLKSVRFGAQDVTHVALDLASGVSGTLDILLSRGAAEVLGAVTNNEGAAVSGALITLWPKGLGPATVWSGPAQSATDQNGDFRIAGLVPGEYYAAAWEELESGLAYDMDFLRRFESQATEVTLKEGAHQTLQPKLISREAAAAEAAKLP